MEKYREDLVSQIINETRFDCNKLQGVRVGRDMTLAMRNQTGRHLVSDTKKNAIENYTRMIGKNLDMPEGIVNKTIRTVTHVMEKQQTKGKSTKLIILACMYYRCREAGLKYLMHDFAHQVERKNVFDLCKAYLNICQILRVKPDVNDATFFAPRFVEELGLPDELRADILAYANQLLDRMKVDWMSHGRRPTGLIAAAFYIACKCFKLERSVEEIARVLRVTPETVRKRVNEFKSLRVAQLTKEEFAALGAEGGAFDPEDPPAFKKTQLLAIEDAPSSEPDPVDRQIALAAIAADQETGAIPKQIAEDEFDEREIDCLLFKPEETKLKQVLWTKNNEDWLKEQQNKHDLQEKKQINRKAQRRNARLSKLDPGQMMRKTSFKSNSSFNSTVQNILNNAALRKQFSEEGLQELFPEKNERDFL